MLQAQSDDDDVGDDVAVNVDTGGFMDEFFEQVSRAVCLFTLHRGPSQRRRPSIYRTGFTANTKCQINPPNPNPDPNYYLSFS